MDNIKRYKVVWLVKQTQPDEGYYETTIYVCSSFKRAQEYARTLNKEYGAHCVFDENWDFVEYDLKGEPHYYEIEEMAVDESLYIGKDEQSN